MWYVTLCSDVVMICIINFIVSIFWLSHLPFCEIWCTYSMDYKEYGVGGVNCLWKIRVNVYSVQGLSPDNKQYSVNSCQQKSIGLKFSKSQTGSDLRYSCHHNSSHFTFPIFAHSCRFSVLHSLQSITPRIY